MSLLELDLHVDESRLISDALAVVLRVRPTWEKKELQPKVFTNGITNKLVGFFAAEDEAKMDGLLVRVYGQKTERLIDRDAEKRNMRLMQEIGCAKPLHAVFRNGLCYGFIKGECLDVDSIRDPHVNKLVAAEMVRIHAIKPKGNETDAVIWRMLNKFLELLPEKMDDEEKDKRYQSLLPHPNQLRIEAAELELELKRKTTSRIAFCHNDLLVGNIVHNKDEDRTFFIDYEYGGFNYVAYDIADHFAEHTGVDAELDFSLYPDKDYQLHWLRNYLQLTAAKEKGISLSDFEGVSGIEIEEKELQKLYVEVNRFALLSHLYWGIWAILQAKFSALDFDFVAYAVSKYGEFKAKRDAFLTL